MLRHGLETQLLSTVCSVLEHPPSLSGMYLYLTFNIQSQCMRLSLSDSQSCIRTILKHMAPSFSGQEL